MEKHCWERHAELVVQHPYTALLDMTRNSVNSYIFRASEQCFLLQVKVDVMKGKFWHNVLLLGPSHLASLFTYTVKVCGEKGCITQTKQVNQHDGNMTYREVSAEHKVDLTSILGLFDDIKFELR